MHSQKRDPPPLLAADETPTPEEISKLARRILGELAREDTVLADRMRRLGILPEID